MSVDVVWVTRYPGRILGRGSWDQGLLEDLFSHEAWRPANAADFMHHDSFDSVSGGLGAVVIVPAQHHADDVDWLNEKLEALDWCLVILTGDEEHLFPWEKLSHRNMKMWIQSPDPEMHASAGRPFPFGYPPHTRRVLASLGDCDRTLNWFYAGQVNNEGRKACTAALERRREERGDGELVVIDGFGAGAGINGAPGLNAEAYATGLAIAKVAPAPHAWKTPDSFRLWEALEAGCVPIVEPDPYWRFLLGARAPLPTLSDWDGFDPVCDALLDRWPVDANRVSAWWQLFKRELAYRLQDDITILRGFSPTPKSLSDVVTVLIPTSPIPAHPSTAVIEATLASVRAQDDLAGCEVVIAIDGVRPEQDSRRADYDEYVRRLLWLCNHRWHNVVPVLGPRWQHQALTARDAMEYVETSAVLFVEHDTPLLGEIPWAGLTAAILDDTANVIRLHHEASVLKPHAKLMLDDAPTFIEGVPLLRTCQWSQRPHLANARFYRRILHTYFGRDARTMIEDVMHGVVDTTWHEQGDAGWERFKLWLYAPDGDMKRSDHLDARGDDPKFPMEFAYDGPTPRFAPAPTAGRVD